MTKELPRDLALAQLRLRSITSGLDVGLTDAFALLLACDSNHHTVTVTRYAHIGATPRQIVFKLKDLVALARMESDHPARAPIRETPPRLSAPPPAEGARISQMLAAVKDVMADGKARTLEEIQEKLALDKGLRHGQPAISARLRDLRKPQFGAWTVERDTVRGVRGLHRYRLVPGSGS